MLLGKGGGRRCFWAPQPIPLLLAQGPSVSFEGQVTVHPALGDGPAWPHCSPLHTVFCEMPRGRPLEKTCWQKSHPPCFGESWICWNRCALAAPCSRKGEPGEISRADPEPGIRVALCWSGSHLLPTIYYVRLRALQIRVVLAGFRVQPKGRGANKAFRSAARGKQSMGGAQ